MKNKSIFKCVSLISLFLIMALVFSSFPIWAENKSLFDDYSNLTVQNKIDSTLYEKAEQQNGKYLVYLQNETIPTETLYEAIKKQTRFDVSLYETEKFSSFVVPELERQILEAQQITNVQSPLTELVLGKPTDLTIKQASQNEMDAYIRAKRSVVENLNSEKNDLFVETYIGDSSDVVFKSRYTSTIIAYLSKEEIERCAKSKETVLIMPYQKRNPIPTEHVVVDQVGADSSTGTQSSQFNNGSGYQGDGIKIGILEAESAKYDPNHPQLAGIHNIRLEVVPNVRENDTEVPLVVSEHATYVTALIVGQVMEVSTLVFEGVAPEATVYQTGCDIDEDFYTGIEALIAKNVSVINLSLGYPPLYLYDGIQYDPRDLYIDSISSLTNVTFVIAAGNEGSSSSTPVSMSVEPQQVVLPAYVSSPGKAYNAITVGNAATKHMNSGKNPPYSMHDTSSYEVASHLTNKPDISAPGYNITFPCIIPASGAINLVRKTGTSFAAPLVTGVVAQLHEANASLIGNPTATKAVLLAGADFEAISATDNEYWDGCFAARVKSGVGFLNAKKAVTIAENRMYQNSTLFMNAPSRYVGYSTSVFVDIPANSKIRIVMTYSKPTEIDTLEDVEDFAYSTNMDIDLVYQQYTNYDSSWTLYNNVEVIECVINTAGRYSIEVYVDALTQTSTRVLMDRSVAWYIEPAS